MKEEVIFELDNTLKALAERFGNDHPELYEAVRIYEELKVSPSRELLQELRRITHNYLAPSNEDKDFIGVYRNLSILDCEYSVEL